MSPIDFEVINWWVAECEMFLFEQVFLDKESKLYLLLLCSRTAHLFYFRELKKILKQIMRKTYTVLWIEKLRDTTFSPRKKEKKIYYTNKPQLYNDLKESCYYLVLFFKSFFLWCLWWKVHESKKLPLLGQLFSFKKKTVEISLFISFPIPPQCVKKGCLPLVNLTW